MLPCRETEEEDRKFRYVRRQRGSAPSHDYFISYSTALSFGYLDIAQHNFMSFSLMCHHVFLALQADKHINSLCLTETVIG